MNKENPDLKDKDLEELEDEIKESIEKIKNRDEKEWPEKKYMELVRKPEEIDREKEEKRKRDKKRKAIMDYTVLFLLLILAVVFIVHEACVEDNTVGTFTELAVSKEGQQVVNNIEFKIEDYYIEDNVLFLNVKVLNKGDNGLYTTVRSMYLVDQNGKEYLPDVDIGEIPVDLFGKKIEPKTQKSALIGFTDFPKSFKKTTLVVNNVSNAHNFVWDYMITLPDE